MKKTNKLFGIMALIVGVMLVGAFALGFTACDNGGGTEGDPSTFVAVTNITGIPANKQTNTDLTLAGTVQPSDATNKTITWSIAADDDGSAGPSLTGNVLQTTSEGTVKVTATVVNGKTANTNYTQNFIINVLDVLPDFVAVTDITGVPTAATVNVNLTLTGSVEPSDATNKTITWSIAATNTLASATVASGVFKATTAGTATVTATVVNGASETADYTKEFSITVSASTPSDPRPSSPETMSTKTAMQYFTEQGITIGINVGNTLDAVQNWVDTTKHPTASPTNPVAVETAWGNVKANQAYFNGLKNLGFKIVRIPVTWMGHIGAAPSYTIEPAYLQRVAEVVNMAHTAGLKAFINIHHDGNNGGQGYTGWLDITKVATDSTITEKYVKVWTQIAEYFKNYGDYLMFQAFNEIQRGDWDHTGTQAEYTIINDWNQRFTNAVRGTGGNNATRYLLYYGYMVSTEIAHNGTFFQLPTDPGNGNNKQIVGFHYYDPWDFSGAAILTDYGNFAPTLTAEFAAFKTKFVDNGIPVIIGENGPARYANWPGNTGYSEPNAAIAHQNRLLFIDLLYGTARQNGIVPIYWENGHYDEATAGEGDFTLINRTTGLANSATSTEVIQRMMTAIAPGGGEETDDVGTALGFDWIKNSDSTSSITAEITSNTITMTGSIGASGYASIIGDPDPPTLAAIKTATQFTLTVTGDGNSYRVMLVTPESETTGEYDHFGKNFTVSESPVTITISELEQLGWGGTVAFDLNNVKGIQIQKAGPGAFNLTVTDIQFE